MGLPPRFLSGRTRGLKLTQRSWKEFLDSIDPLDEFLFLKPVAGQSAEDEIERLEHNLACYREYMKNRSTFPKWVHEQRAADFHRLRELRGQTSA